MEEGAVLWILNDQTWTRSIGEFVVWFCYYDLWSKVKVFGDMFKGYDAQEEEVQRSGPKNMLDSLEHSFNEQQLEALRLSLGKSKERHKAPALRMEEPQIHHLQQPDGALHEDAGVSYGVAGCQG